ncbi:Auxin-binding protein 1 [Morella rubra]|uniref:Auxin-binding protein 1 n=1 Tax=Morella rubra TaxID=262757 RepID=A0A6A1UTI3_9ROSI|nr:Auxin-binding protein 1 [Morella rubra]
MNTLIPTSLGNSQISRFRFTTPILRRSWFHAYSRTKSFKLHTSPSEIDTQTVEEPKEETQAEPNEASKKATPSSAPAALDKDLKKPDFKIPFHDSNFRRSWFMLNQELQTAYQSVVQKTAATFAPRASTATKNPAVPGTALYTVFEVQGYASMLLGGALSFNLIFPSNEPDIWRLMGMWSIWMFTIPSLRARDCSKNEKEALNYLFLLIPLLNVAIPFFWKSFALVWSADTIAFLGMYAWKLPWRMWVAGNWFVRTAGCDRISDEDGGVTAALDRVMVATVIFEGIEFVMKVLFIYEDWFMPHIAAKWKFPYYWDEQCLQTPPTLKDDL